MKEERIGPHRLFLGDCLEVMQTLGKVDAVVTDPPYGVGFKYSTHNDSRDGYREWCGHWFGALRQKTEGPIAISCGITNISEWPKPDWVLAWHKPAAMGRCFVGFNNWEPVLLYGKGRNGQTADIFRAPITPDAELGGHPCPKPLGWGIEIVGRLSALGDTILDPFMGSGTTLVACQKLGRAGIGIELDPEYFAIACRRVDEAMRQPDLFIQPAVAPVQESLL